MVEMSSHFMQGFIHDCVDISFPKLICGISEHEIDTIIEAVNKNVSNFAFGILNDPRKMMYHSTDERTYAGALRAGGGLLRRNKYG